MYADGTGLDNEDEVNDTLEDMRVAEEIAKRHTMELIRKATEEKRKREHAEKIRKDREERDRRLAEGIEKRRLLRQKLDNIKEQRYRDAKKLQIEEEERVRGEERAREESLRREEERWAVQSLLEAVDSERRGMEAEEVRQREVLFVYSLYSLYSILA